jgi:hypothetical protein
MTSIYRDRNYLRMLPDAKLVEIAREGHNDLARVLAERLKPDELYHAPHGEYAKQRTRGAG